MYRTPWNRSYGYNPWVVFIGMLVGLILFSLPFLGEVSKETIELKNQQKIEALRSK